MLGRYVLGRYMLGRYMFFTVFTRTLQLILQVISPLGNCFRYIPLLGPTVVHGSRIPDLPKPKASDSIQTSGRIHHVQVITLNACMRQVRVPLPMHATQTVLHILVLVIPSLCSIVQCTVSA
jgi:hypothetical protein